LAVALPLLVLALVQLGVASWRLFAERASASSIHEVGVEGGTVRRGLVVAGWIVGFAAIIWLLGFAIGSALASLTYLRAAATERWRTAIIYAVLVYVCIAVGFDYALGITFPPGVIRSALIPIIRGT
jgi:hypothetical protein